MNHSITVAGLLGAFGILAGLVCAALGFIAWSAGGMSDNFEASARAQSEGCTFVIIGLLLLVGSITVLAL